LTIIIGAKCYDGIVLIADRKVTDFSGRTKRYTNKIFAGMEHILIGYGGGEEEFDIFKKYIIGDITLLRHDENRYTFDNLIPNIKQSVVRFNKFVSELSHLLKYLLENI
jgi:20S proteasome alpha/beta subunit